MKNEKYHTVGTISNSNRKNVHVGTVKIDTLTHKYMTIHFLG